MPIIARRLMIFGRVQGVFYRNWTKQAAHELGLAGWVRNRLDGSVEALVEGAEDTVERFIASAHEGPSAAQVARIEVTEEAVIGLASFDKRPTG